MSRAKLKEWLVKQKLSLVAMESSGGAHYWARFAKSLGHKVMPIPPKQVKPFRTGQKQMLMTPSLLLLLLLLELPTLNQQGC